MTARPVNVLMVEDSEHDARLLELELSTPDSSAGSTRAGFLESDHPACGSYVA